MWGESYHGMKAQREVLSAWEKAKSGITSPKQPDAPDMVMALAEDEWQKLKQAVEFPKLTLGFHPALASQLIPLAAAIMDATTNDPKQKPPG